MADRLTIELRGVEFVNKGAELMLRAILEQTARFPMPVRLVMEPSPRASVTQIRAAGMSPKSGFHRLPRLWTNAIGRVHETEVDMVLDASGYAYGDSWGAAKAKRRIADHILRWKRQGKTVILMPQAFGPFTRPELAEAMRHVFRNADRVYVRDATSLSHVTALYQGPGIRRMPDFTNLAAPVVPADPARYADRVAVIPNIKMIEAVTDGSGYVARIAELIGAIRSEGREAFLLLHEADKDVKVAALIQAALAEPVEVVSDPDPLAIKGIIGASAAVVTSRFHGLVSALSQSVPCLATSWSHKYEELLGEYGYPEGLIREGEPIGIPIRRLLDPDTQRADRARLAPMAARFKDGSRELWADIQALAIGLSQGR